MARGDWTVFEEVAATIGDEVHDFAADTFRLGLVDNTSPPTASDATPTWADYSANEVSTAGGYTSGGETVANTAYAEVGGVATFDGDAVVVSHNGSGFTDAYWAILYNDTAPLNNAIGFMDLGGPVSEQDGDVTIDWHTSGIFTLTVS